MIFSIFRDDRRHVYGATELIRAFHCELGLKTEFSPERISAFLSQSCLSGRAAMFTARAGFGEIVGVLACQIGDNYLTGETMAEESFIYVKPKARQGSVSDALFKSFEDWAIENKASSIRVTSQSGLRGQSVGAWYGRRGYRLYEETYMKEVQT